MLLAGGQGTRLGSLTRKRAKPGVSFYGRYRIIDFTLSNCINSNINKVGVLIQYQPESIVSHIGLGSAWGLGNPVTGVQMLSPSPTQGNWYTGTANAVHQNMEFIDYHNPEYVIILSGDHVYKMDYSRMIEFHKAKKSEITIAAIEVPWEETSRFGILSADEEGRITKITEKPKIAGSNLASMGIYIFNSSTLKQALTADANDYQSQHDFGRNIIPQLLKQKKRMYTYKFHGYWRDVGTIETYYRANMESLKKDHFLNMPDSKFQIFSKEATLSQHLVGPTAKIENSLVCNGCIVHGEVSNTIVAPGVYVGKGVKIKNSILLPFAKIYNNSRIINTIIGESAQIMSDCNIGAWGSTDPEHKGITVIEDDTVVRENTIIRDGNNEVKQNVAIVCLELNTG